MVLLRFIPICRTATVSPLHQLAKGAFAKVHHVEDRHEGDPISRRLRELGFVEGRTVVIRAWGPFGKDPLMVQIGDSRFALRRSEAARVLVDRE